jgi:hypothetical protein
MKIATPCASPMEEFAAAEGMEEASKIADLHTIKWSARQLIDRTGMAYEHRNSR